MAYRSSRNRSGGTIALRGHDLAADDGLAAIDNMFGVIDVTPKCRPSSWLYRICVFPPSYAENTATPVL
jgi:hypothetical protein